MSCVVKSKSAQFLRVPSLLLAAALQVLPIVRVALPAAETAANVLAIIFRWSIGAAAAFGGVNAVSGASTLINSPLNVKGTNGVPFSLRLSTAPNAAHYWTATGVPAGLALTGTSGSTLWTIAGTPTVTGVYNVGLTAKGQVTDGLDRTVSGTLVLTIVAGAAPPSPPSITTQPVSVTATQGLSAAFSVAASGSAPLSYQWRFNNANLSGKTTSSLTINPVSTSNAGNYSVVVSNSGGSVTSSVVSLTVVVPVTPPSITTQPVSLTATQGLSASFSVAASGSAPLSYQWRFNNANLSGQTASSLTFNPVSTSNAGNYSVVVSNSGGSVTSSVVSLTVVVPVTPPSITTQPASLTATQGLSAAFSVGATGSAPLSYQWRFKSANLAGQTASSLTINPVSTNNAGNYDVIVSNSGGSVTSSVVALTVVVPITPPSITSQPVSLVTTQGLSATFTVGAGGSAPLSYQWRFKNAALAGQTASSLTFNPVSTNNAGNYDVIVSNSGGSVTSSVVTLTVSAPVAHPLISTQPVSQSVVQGQSASLSVVATGSAPLSYQWRFKNAALAGQTSSILAFNPVSTNNAGNYDVIVSNSAGSVTSLVATLTVTLPAIAPAIMTQPVAQTVTQGQTAGFTVGASGTAPLTYFWRKGTTVVSVGTTAGFSIANAQTNDAGSYSVIVSNIAGTVTSSSVSLTVNPAPQPPVISSSPTNRAVVLNSSTTFTVIATGTAPLAYQWYFNSTPVSGQTALSYTIGSVQAANLGSYYAVVTNAYGRATSSVATVTQILPPSIVSQPSDVTTNVGTAVQLTVSASSSAPLGYQWFKNGSSLGNSVRIIGAKSNVLSLINISTNDAGNYSVLVTNIAGAVTSQVAVLTAMIPVPATAPLTVHIVGAGSVSPNYDGQLLLVGSNYTMTATADSGNSFAGWSGGLNANSATLNFVMQSNLVLTATFQATPTGPTFTNGTYTGLFYEESGVANLTSGYITVTTTANGKYSGKVSTAGKTYPFTGKFDATGLATNSIGRGVVKFQVELALSTDDPDQITGRVTDGNWSANLIADRAVFNAGNPAPQAGRYTLALPGTPETTMSAAGAGYASVTVNNFGRVQIKGVLADGSKISQTTTISKSGHWPLYVSLYRGVGSLLGWLTFETQSDGDIHGPVSWTKKQLPADRLYPGGFAVTSEAVGSAYSMPTGGTQVLNLTNGVLTLSGGSFTQALSDEILLNSNNKITVVSGSKAIFNLTPATGLFKGSIVNPATGKAVLFSGAVLQKQNRGFGYFINAAQSGDVYIGP